MAHLYGGHPSAHTYRAMPLYEQRPHYHADRDASAVVIGGQAVVAWRGRPADRACSRAITPPLADANAAFNLLDRLEQAQQQVAAGARLVSQLRPGWALLVRPRELDLSRIYSCVLTQVWGSYSEGLAAVGCHPTDIDRLVELGLSVTWEETEDMVVSDAVYRTLRDAWIAHASLNAAATVN